MNIAIFRLTLMVPCNANNQCFCYAEWYVGFCFGNGHCGEKMFYSLEERFETFKLFIWQVKEQLRKVSSHIIYRNKTESSWLSWQFNKPSFQNSLWKYLREKKGRGMTLHWHKESSNPVFFKYLKMSAFFFTFYIC